MPDSLSHARTRWTLGAAAVLTGLILAAVTGLAQAQAPAASATAAATATTVPVLSWTQWLQNVVNVMKLVELGAFIFGAYQFWAGRRERRAADAEQTIRARIDSNYQAWQVINSAQGKGGSGGRVEALRDLLLNGESLAGINLDDAWLEHVSLPKAKLVRSSLQRANLTHADLSGANLDGANLTGADLVTANLAGASLKHANLTGARLSAASLDGADMQDVIGWRDLKSVSHARIDGIRNAPAGFKEWAREQGAVDASTAPESADDLSFSRAFRAV
jgi:hypothetical protein